MSTPLLPLDGSPARNTRSNSLPLETPRKARPSGGSKNNTPDSARKAPACRHCGKPRRGHPRSGCPKTKTAANLDGSEDEDVPTTPSKKPISNNLNSAIGSMRLRSESPVKSAEDVRREMVRHRRLAATSPAPPVERAQSLDSISSESSSLLHKLEQALVDPNDDEEDDGDTEIMENHNQDSQGGEAEPRRSRTGEDPSSKVVRWQDKIQAAQRFTRSSQRRRPSQVMPGTLVTPSFTASDLSQYSLESDGSQASSDHVFLHKQEPTDEDVPMEQVLGTTPMTVNSALLARDLTEEESNALVGSVAEVDTPAVIITIPKGLVMDAKYAAEREGLFTRQRLLPDEEESFMVVGTDEKEVERLWILLLKLEGHEEPYKYAGLPGLVGARVSGISPKKNNVDPAEEGNKKGDRNRRVSGGQLGLMAGSVAVGAAAMFTTLAM